MTTQQILQGIHDWTNGKIVYDISVAHPDGQGNPTPYADLTAALGTGGANIPEGLRKGGMSIKFVQTSDNKYVQARCMAQNFTTDVTQWQEVDVKSAAGSKNLIESGGVNSEIAESSYGNAVFTIQETTTVYTDLLTPVVGKKYIIVITLEESVTNAYISLNTASSSSAVGQWLVNNKPLSAGNHYYMFTYNGETHLRVYLDNGTKSYSLTWNELISESYPKLFTKVNTIDSEVKTKADKGDLFNIVGYIGYDGAYNESQNYRCTDYLSIDKNDSIGIKGFKSNSISVCCFYDASLNFISYYDVANAQPCIIIIASENIPSTAVYIRCSTHKDYTDSYVNNKGIALSNIQSEIISNKKVNIETQKEVKKNFGELFKIAGYINNAQGALVKGNETYTYTDYLPIDRSDSIRIKGIKTTNIAVCYFYKENLDPISSYSTPNANPCEITIPSSSIPEDAVYIRCSSAAIYEDSYVINKGISLLGVQNGVGTAKEEINQKAIIGNVFKINGAILKSNGQVSERTYYICTDYLPINRSYNIEVCGVGSTTFALCAFYDSDRNYISSYAQTGSPGTIETILASSIPENAAYIRCTSYEENSNSLVRNEGISLLGSFKEAEKAKKSVSDYAELLYKKIKFETDVKAREQYLRELYKNSGEDAHWYGCQWTEIDNPDNVTAINSEGDSSLHTTLPIQSKMRRCIVKDGKVVYYLDANNSELKEDGTAAKLDGTDGNVMVEIPEFFYKFEVEVEQGVRTIRLKLSEQGLDGFNYMYRHYTSAYEATINRTTEKLASVCTTVFARQNQNVVVETGSYIEGSDVNLGNFEVATRSGFSSNAVNYRGGTNNDTWDNANDPTISVNTDPEYHTFARNQLGIPVSDVNRDEIRNYADAISGSLPYLYDTQRALWMLSTVEFKTRDLQGGSPLGDGATVFPSYAGYEKFFASPTAPRGIACLPCGVTNSLGNQSGFVYYKMQDVPVDATGTYPYNDIQWNRWGNVYMPIVSYRGIENYYGHLYKIGDQLNVHIVDTGEYVDGHSGEYNYKIMNVTYYYQHSPFNTDNELHSLDNLGTFTFACHTKDIKSILAVDGHILPIDSSMNMPRGYSNYCDACEMDFSHVDVYTTFNGRIVSGRMCGPNFIVAADAINGTTRRASDGTRLTIIPE